VISRIHRQLGTAGFLISIIALIAALGGGAYAASGGFSAKQKKEIRKIAKSVATPGPQGPAGPSGSQGTSGSAGPKGDRGENGANGSDGTNGVAGTDGTDGENVSVIPLAAANGTGHCEEGGAKFTNGTGEAFACNGKVGGGESTEMGFWESQGEKGFVLGEVFAVTTISFPRPLDAAPTETVMVDFDATDEDKAKCPGELFDPKATPGVLCLYPAFLEPTVTPIGPGAQKFGAVLFFPKTYTDYGSWAVEAS
jgi:hypothetical protein